MEKLAWVAGVAAGVDEVLGALIDTGLARVARVAGVGFERAKVPENMIYVFSGTSMGDFQNPCHPLPPQCFWAFYPCHLAPMALPEAVGAGDAWGPAS